MIKIGKLTDYAIMILAHLCQGEEENSLKSSSELAEEAKLPEPTVAKILKMLTREGLVLSKRGAYGGYLLEKSLYTISVLEVINAMEGTVGISSWNDADGSNCECDKDTEKCPVTTNWEDVNHVICQALQDVKLADIVTGCGLSCSQIISRLHPEHGKTVRG